MRFYFNAFKDNNISCFNNSNNNNHIDINLKPEPDKFYLDIYKIAILDIFKLKNTNSAKKIMQLNKSIKAHNLQNKKPKMDFFILLNTIIKTMILYENANKNYFKAKMNLLIKI